MKTPVLDHAYWVKVEDPESAGLKSNIELARRTESGWVDKYSGEDIEGVVLAWAELCDMPKITAQWSDFRNKGIEDCPFCGKEPDRGKKEVALGTVSTISHCELRVEWTDRYDFEERWDLIARSVRKELALMEEARSRLGPGWVNRGKKS